MSMKKATTLADIARRSKVSLSTVSLVLRDKPGIPQETRQRVFTAAKVLGYKRKLRSASHQALPHTNASKLHNLGLILKSEPGLKPLINPFYSQVLDGIEETCRKRHINLLYATLPVDENNKPVDSPRLLSDNQVDGLLLVGAFVDETLAHVLGQKTLPVVLVDAYASKNHYDAVVSDNLRGASQAVSYLIAHGHRRIGLVGSHPNAYPSLQERRQGYFDALHIHGLTEFFCADSSQQIEEIKQAALALLAREPTLTALFGCNDHAALAAMQVLQAQGHRFPDDISVVGFDDIDLAHDAHPSLTTMHVDKLGMGRMAVHLLANRLEFPDSEAVTSVFSPRLIERDSVNKLS